ncbi:uncharacterized protein TNCV_2925111 [Trichonephila clavipes]|nr:uncharacterized protein TNCV_2925111 [Trichonephila clavipes]
MQMDSTSAIHCLERSCPQGSVSGPILWNIIINDLLSKLNNLACCEIIVFADDILICSQDRDLSATFLHAQEALNLASDWSKGFKLDFSPDKTRIMAIGKRNKQPGTTSGFPEPASSVAGKGHYGHPSLSSKVTEISNIRFRILVRHPENDHKCPFSTPRLLEESSCTVCFIDSRPELSGKVATISHIGYLIRLPALKYDRDQVFPLQGF